MAIEHYLAAWVGKFIGFFINAKQIADSSNIRVAQLFLVCPGYRLSIQRVQRDTRHSDYLASFNRTKHFLVIAWLKPGCMDNFCDSFSGDSGHGLVLSLPCFQPD
ncbi:TPA: hypothetical protein LC370_003028 [Salmonella enterica subsp. arizonae serovar 56:z4,z23:-]|nr:hypothetical protein [Salmonella enterica subsp. arizonae serovar 56:z4,z23:-]